MVRLNILVEGPTESAFVKSVLAPHLGGLGIGAVGRRVETSRDRARGRVFRGGGLSYEQVKNDLLDWMQEDGSSTGVWFSTMFDFYALSGKFPGKAAADRLTDPYRRVEVREAAFGDKIGDRRFIPYMQLHEFEALLLSRPAAFLVSYPGKNREVRDLEHDMAGVSTPELVDHGEATHPAKRIGRVFPRYLHEKAKVGPQVAEEIGLATIRSKCPHFDAWVRKIEALRDE